MQKNLWLVPGHQARKCQCWDLNADDLAQVLTGQSTTSSGFGVGTDNCQVWEVRGSSAYQRLLAMHLC